MPDEPIPTNNTQITTQTSVETTGNLPPDSSFLGISIRAWVVMMLVGTICLSHLSVTSAVLIDAIFFSKDWSRVGTYANISEPLYGAVMIGIGFFFGQKPNK